MRVAVVDGSELVRLVIEQFLIDLGHDAVSYGSPEELLSGPKNGALGLDSVIVDIEAFCGDQGALMRRIHDRHPDAAIVIMRSTEPPLPVGQAVSDGVYGYIHKPVRLAELELTLIRLAEDDFTPSDPPEWAKA